MKHQNTIRYVQRSEIETRRWDRCIDNALNGLIYGYSFYLDAMSSSWDGIVLNDYEAVMPLPFRKKFGISYLYHPFLTAQLGVFGKQIDASLVDQFLDAIPEKFRLWDFSLNHHNNFPEIHYPLYQRSNYILDLTPDYPILQKNYRENIRRNIRKSLQYNNQVVRDLDVDEVISLSKMQTKDYTNEDFENFRNLYMQLKSKNKAFSYGVQSQQQQLLSSAIFFFSHHRAYYILVGNHPNGRTLGASHALIDAFIQDFAGRKILLDFEGSDIRNLAFFYSSFGAREEIYPAIRLNKLPWWIRWLKKISV